MAPMIGLHDPNMDEAPMSRTHQYRKVMKPLLERKRRARINKCLDDLKDLMVYAMQSEGESITKLEKGRSNNLANLESRFGNIRIFFISKYNSLDVF